MVALLHSLGVFFVALGVFKAVLALLLRWKEDSHAR